MPRHFVYGKGCAGKARELARKGGSDAAAARAEEAIVAHGAWKAAMSGRRSTFLASDALRGLAEAALAAMGPLDRRLALAEAMDDALAADEPGLARWLVSRGLDPSPLAAMRAGGARLPRLAEFAGAAAAGRVDLAGAQGWCSLAAVHGAFKCIDALEELGVGAAERRRAWARAPAGGDASVAEAALDILGEAHPWVVASAPSSLRREEPADAGRWERARAAWAPTDRALARMAWRALARRSCEKPSLRGLALLADEGPAMGKAESRWAGEAERSLCAQADLSDWDADDALLAKALSRWLARRAPPGLAQEIFEDLAREAERSWINREGNLAWDAAGALGAMARWVSACDGIWGAVDPKAAAEACGQIAARLAGMSAEEIQRMDSIERAQAARAMAALDQAAGPEHGPKAARKVRL